MFTLTWILEKGIKALFSSNDIHSYHLIKLRHPNAAIVDLQFRDVHYFNINVRFFKLIETTLYINNKKV